jgi:hypothetical protein
MAQIQGDALRNVYVVGVSFDCPEDLFVLPEMKYKPRSSAASTAGQFAGTVPGKEPLKSMNVPVAEPLKSMNVPVAEPLFPPAQAAGAETNTAPATTQRRPRGRNLQ